MMSQPTTPSQTVGPFFHIGLRWRFIDDLTKPGIDRDKVTIKGRVLDGDGKPVSDALIEIWQADAQGRYAHHDDGQDTPMEHGFTGFGRVATDDDGAFRFATIKPGRVRAPNGDWQAPHLNVTIFARGLLKHLITRMYFPGDAANDGDGVLQLVPAQRRATLIAQPIDGRMNALRWNVILQGGSETVFFEY